METTTLLTYTTFIRPLLEYSYNVWNGCPLQYMKKLEKVQLYAPRITMGLSIISSRDSLHVYLETSWKPLLDRRRVAKLSTMFKVHHNLVPDYLKITFPPTRNSESNYNTRNGEDILFLNVDLNCLGNPLSPTQLNNGTI